VIKVVHPWLAEDPSAVRLFVDEAKLSARIDHPNVVHIHEFGEFDGTYYLAMEFVDGPSLARILRVLWQDRRTLSAELAVQIASQIADGLHAAHETRGDDGSPLGIVHRDVSPQNVLIAQRGHVKLIDFGIASSRQRLEKTRPGELRGKFAYMSPEQAAGERLDRRADIYALGVMLWEMLTNHRLFAGENEIEIFRMVAHPEIAPPRRFNPALSPELDDVVMAALAIDPSNRPATAREFRERLVAALPSAAYVSEGDLADLVASTDKSSTAARGSENTITFGSEVSAAQTAPFASEEDIESDSRGAFVSRASPRGARGKTVLAIAIALIVASAVAWRMQSAWRSTERAPAVTRTVQTNPVPSPPIGVTQPPARLEPPASSGTAAVEPSAPASAVSASMRPSSTARPRTSHRRTSHRPRTRNRERPPIVEEL
jgi:serine/threonine-protein kinase